MQTGFELLKASCILTRWVWSCCRTWGSLLPTGGCDLMRASIWFNQSASWFSCCCCRSISTCCNLKDQHEHKTIKPPVYDACLYRAASTSSLIVGSTRLCSVGDRVFPLAVVLIWNSLAESLGSLSLALWLNHLQTDCLNNAISSGSND